MVAVNRLGRHGNRRSCELGYTQHLPTYIQTASGGDNHTAGFSDNGTGYRPCHHRIGGLIWSRFLLV